ncbi:single-stranded-DNA-specific exonuclease RecJ [Erythrobacteraceae bacterium CFH 75059]|nr:single-stranded-DNA-specific exonuclease RecJ [Erythrobacteraceae bacterium CFH 75059]
MQTPAACGVSRSLTGRRWEWRGGTLDLTATGANIPGESLLRHLLMTRGVPEHDVERHRAPTLRAFLPDPSIFRDMDTAADRIAQAIAAGEPVTVFGDYDVDGATSAALLLRLFAMLGQEADAYIPDRIAEGYGPSVAAMKRIAGRGTRLVVTVDCGAMAHDALQAAAEAGLDVIVVDHHQCSDALPPALAVVNPNRRDEGDEAASHGHLAAVGVAFLLAIAVVRSLRARNFFSHRAEPDLLSLLDLVALGTVADVAPLHGLNRAFVAQGLKVLARGANVGLAALVNASRLHRAPRCSDLGFALGPRINAGGRVGRASLGVDLLTASDEAQASALAAELSRLNEERRAIEHQVREEAEQQLAAQQDRHVVIAHGSGWHPGVIGIVAGRIKERTERPAIVLAVDPDTGVSKGSGRSIAGVDLGAAIIAAKDAGLLLAGGGHAMAAGMTVAAEGIPAFADFLEAQLAARVARSRASRALLLDLAVLPRGLNADLAERIDAAGPFGVGWPAPRVALGPVRILNASIVGRDHVRFLAAGEDGARVKAVAFRAAETQWGQSLLHASAERRYWLAGRVSLDEWGARRSAELHVEDAAHA